MAIPSGYRLLTAEDIGKVFGVDLELEIKFDTDQDPIADILPNGSTQLTNFVRGVFGSGAEDYKTIEVNSDAVYNFGWLAENYTFSENVEIASYNTDISNWNTWLYVKDIVNPYKIKMSKQFLNIECKDKKMTENLVIQAPESGGAEPPYTSNIVNNTPSEISFNCSIPDENGVLVERTINPGESITIKHYGIFAWVRGGNWNYSWNGVTYAPSTYGTYYCIQTGDTSNVYTLSVTPTASGGAD